MRFGGDWPYLRIWRLMPRLKICWSKPERSSIHRSLLFSGILDTPSPSHRSLLIGTSNKTHVCPERTLDIPNPPKKPGEKKWKNWSKGTPTQPEAREIGCGEPSEDYSISCFLPPQTPPKWAPFKFVTAKSNRAETSRVFREMIWRCISVSIHYS